MVNGARSAGGGGGGGIVLPATRAAGGGGWGIVLPAAKGAGGAAGPVGSAARACSGRRMLTYSSSAREKAQASAAVWALPRHRRAGSL